MIFGNCPYDGCTYANNTACAEKFQTMSKEVCGGCGKTYWLQHSRIIPIAYTEDMVIVNEETKSVKIREESK